MFALSTADIALTFRIMTKELPKINDPKELELGLKYIHAKDTIFVANNFVADLILLYRCYMVWGRSKYILAGASLLVLADSVWGFLGIGTTLLSPTQASPFIPLYAIGRIFWVSRIARRIVGQRQFNSYHTTVAIFGLGRITRDIGNPATMSETEARTTSVVLDTIISSMHDGDENRGPILRPRPSDEEAANPSRDFDAINLSK
ncbi:hypothetical protein BDZ97DRAFT_1851155 [Flammula alnicola]|nr:hypothetical protein BDZ97DRAFT_1851155 [Flammula alnicola]